MKNLQLALTTSVVALMAAGCGGGGSTAAPSGKVSITSSNAVAIVKGAMTTSQTVVRTGSGGASVVGVVVQTGAPKQSVMEIALAQLKRVHDIKAAATPAIPMGASVSAPDIYGCGAFANTSTVTSNLNPSNGTLTIDYQGTTAGSVITITAVSLSYNACVEPNLQVPGASTTLSGTMALSINSPSGGIVRGTVATAAAPIIESVSMSFVNFTSEDTIPNAASNKVTLSGGMNVAINDDGTTLKALMTGSTFSMSSSLDGAFTMKNFSIDEWQDSPALSVATGKYSFAVAMTTNLVNAAAGVNGDVVISTPTRFAGLGVEDPSSGMMRVDGNNGSYLAVTVNSNKQVTVTANDGTAAIQPVLTKTLTWAEI